jgi:hypothetical protein
MKAEDYKEIAEGLQEVVWDIEDALDTNSQFSYDRLKQLEHIHEQCKLFIQHFDHYENTLIVRNEGIDFEKVVFNLNYIKNVLMHFNGSLAFLCKQKLMGHNLDLTNRQFDLNFDNICVTIKEEGERIYHIVGGIEIYDDAGNHINTYTMEQIKKSYIGYRNRLTNNELKNL